MPRLRQSAAAPWHAEEVDGPPLAVIVALVMGIAVPVLLFVAVRRLMASDRSSGGSGVGNAMAEINEMLQPQQPSVEMFQKDVERDHDDDREPK